MSPRWPAWLDPTGSAWRLFAVFMAGATGGWIAHWRGAPPVAAVVIGAMCGLAMNAILMPDLPAPPEKS